MNHLLVNTIKLIYRAEQIDINNINSLLCRHFALF